MFKAGKKKEEKKAFTDLETSQNSTIIYLLILLHDYLFCHDLNVLLQDWLTQSLHQQWHKFGAKAVMKKDGAAINHESDATFIEHPPPSWVIP